MDRKREKVWENRKPEEAVVEREKAKHLVGCEWYLEQWNSPDCVFLFRNFYQFIT